MNFLRISLNGNHLLFGHTHQSLLIDSTIQLSTFFLQHLIIITLSLPSSDQKAGTMFKLGYLILLAPAALASPGFLSPLAARDTCEDPLVACGTVCIAPIDICCPAAPNGQIIGCSGTDNCWVNPDGSPGCCPLFSNCDGYEAGQGVYGTLPSVTSPTAVPTVSSVQSPPTVGIPSVVSTSSAVSTSSIVPPVSPVSPPPPPAKTTAASSRVPIPLSTGNPSTPVGTGYLPSHTSSYPSGPTGPSAPVYTGAAYSLSTPAASILAFLFLGLIA